MLKKLFMVLSVITVINMRAMDEPESQSVCYLALMPLDIQKLIVYFLMVPKKVEPTSYYKYFPTTSLYPGKAIGAYCPNEIKIVLLNVCRGLNQPFVMCTIVDPQKEKDEEKVIYTGELEKRDYKAIALSSDAKMIANIHSGYKSEKSFVLEVQEFSTPKKKIQKFDLPEKFIPSSVAFNKSGAYVIVNGTQKKGEYIKFPLKISKPNKEELQSANVEEKLTPLQEYFRVEGVCKLIGNGSQY